MPNHVKPLLLVGAGPMARDYAKVLAALEVPFAVVGRGAASAASFEEATGVPVVLGGLDRYLASGTTPPDLAIVAVDVAQLAATTRRLLEHGVRRILVEKPAGLDAAEILAVAEAAAERDAEVFVAYNRRFYASTIAARELIAADGGVTSFQFEFTEWAHTIEPLPTASAIKAQWFLANSSHVADLAYHLGGLPVEWSAYVAGALPWHPAGAVFAGAGVADGGALFSYHANWASPGRWGVEILTRAHRLIFRPMEQLHVQVIGSVALTKLEIDDQADLAFKPGLYREVEAFLGRAPADHLLSISEQRRIVDGVYARMAPPRATPA